MYKEEPQGRKESTKDHVTMGVVTRQRTKGVLLRISSITSRDYISLEIVGIVASLCLCTIHFFRMKVSLSR